MMNDNELHRLSQLLGEALHKQKATLATVESCTGGLVAKLMTDISGSSAWFYGSIISYSNSLKQRLVQVSEQTLSNYGAVSEQTVREMARGGSWRMGADYTVAITGFAGPATDAGLPVGLVWFGFATSNGAVTTKRQQFEGDREQIRRQAAGFALDWSLKQLSEK